MNIIWTVIRSIIYKIPLKLLLVLLAVFGIFFACFSSAENVSNLITNISSIDINLNQWEYYWLVDTQNISSNYWTYCIHINSMSANNNNVGRFSLWFNNTYSNNTDTAMNIYTDWWSVYACIYTNMRYIFVYNNSYYPISLNFDLFKLNVLMNTEIPVLTSLECQTEYNLIPVSSVDSEYCESNNLCSSSECPSYTWDLTPWVSNIFINDVFHPWAFNVIMNIPEEIDRDYTYTNSWTNFNLDIVGYNQDEEYIQSVIDVQNYKPTSEDFTRVFSNISNFWALLIACLFVILVFYMLKKAFK